VYAALVNIRIASKFLPEANTLAYPAVESLTNKKKFYDIQSWFYNLTKKRIKKREKLSKDFKQVEVNGLERERERNRKDKQRERRIEREGKGEKNEDRERERGLIR
jgi:hypothetical protein